MDYSASSFGKKSRKRRASGGFTLVELLVVVAIIAILMSLMMPSISGAMRQGRMVQCSSNMHQVHVAALAYMNEQPRRHELFWRFANGTADYPWESGQYNVNQPGKECWGSPAKTLERRGDTKLSYLPDGRVFFCPSVRLDYETWYNPAPPGDWKSVHGTYSWMYRHINRVDDPYDRVINHSELRNVNPESVDVVYMDSHFWNEWTNHGIRFSEIHANTLMATGYVVRRPFRTQAEITAWVGNR